MTPGGEDGDCEVLVLGVDVIKLQHARIALAAVFATVVGKVLKYLNARLTANLPLI